MTAKQVPSPMIAVDKNFGREVLVGIVDGNRHITNGFTSDWPTTIHYRTLAHGPFSVLVGARQPVEVRVMLDGTLLCEQFLDPLPSPRASNSRSDVVRKAGELTNQPQPFFISFDDNGGLLKFAADAQGRSPEELLRLQLHPEPLTPVRGPVMHVGEMPSGLFDAVVDLPSIPPGAQARAGLAPLPVSPPAPELHNPEPEQLGSTTAAGDDEGRRDIDRPESATGNGEGVRDIATPESATGNGEGVRDIATPESATGNSEGVRDIASPEQATGNGEGVRDIASPEPAPMVRAQVDAQGTVLPSNHHIQAPVPTAWAPSHGLVVIGVRMVQTAQEGEPTLPPDGFEYVLFQLNTWENHARIRANLHSRIQLGPRVKFPERVDGHVHTDDGPCGCGHSHGFNPQRFR
jgi:hypothetical protein